MYPYGGRSLDVVHDFEFDKESVYFIINIILAMFFLSKKKTLWPQIHEKQYSNHCSLKTTI